MTLEEIKPPVIDHRAKSRKLIKGGGLITLGWAFIVLTLLFARREDLTDLTLNEWGDFLAGVSAPLALLWLVLGYFQQGLELQQNTEALRLQYQELKRQVKETAELAKNSGQQAAASARQAEAAEKLVAVTDETAKQAAEQATAIHRPVFSAVGASGGPGGVLLKIANLGATVTHVGGMLVEKGGKIIPLPYMGSWQHRVEHTLSLGSSPSYPIALCLEFTNALEARQKHYHLIVEFGKLKALSQSEFDRELTNLALG